jgi:YCII-related domain
MSTYVLTYRAPRDYQPGNRAEMAAWQTWFEQLGDALLDAGNPVFSRTTIGAMTNDTDLGGYSLVTAGSLDEAVRLAHGCPFMALGGGVEVGEITPLGELSTATTAEDHARATGLAT